MDKIRKVTNLINKLKCPVRIKPKEYSLETWTTGIGLPTDGYVELHGPWPFREVEWLEINPTVFEIIGRLVASKQWNYLDQIISLLQIEGVKHSIVDGMVRTPFEALSN